jgi:HAD superfamily phosphoserine phosphatase-like hydrolase
MIRAVLLDFDGTLVTKDILDIVCGITGHEGDSRKINEAYQSGKMDTSKSIEGLCTRINYLEGVTPEQIRKILDKNTYLMPGAKELIDFLNKEKIITILHSRNIEPVLKYYQDKLGIMHITCTRPKLKRDGTIIGITPEDVPARDFKLAGCKDWLAKHELTMKDALSIGDSNADLHIFNESYASIAINPKGGVEKYATHLIHNDLKKAIPIILSYIQNS